jgi:hypothetical protein
MRSGGIAGNDFNDAMVGKYTSEGWRSRAYAVWPSAVTWLTHGALAEV